MSAALKGGNLQVHLYKCSYPLSLLIFAQILSFNMYSLCTLYLATNSVMHGFYDSCMLQDNKFARLYDMLIVPLDAKKICSQIPLIIVYYWGFTVINFNYYMQMLSSSLNNRKNKSA